MIEALTFDFWNTLYIVPNEQGQPHQRLLRLESLFGEFGITRPREQIKAALKSTWEYAYTVQRSEGLDIGPRGQVERLIGELGLQLDEAEKTRVYESYTSYLRSNPPQINEGVCDVVPVLASRYKLAVICNTGASPGTLLVEILKKDGLAEYFRQMVFSDEVVWAKPNTRIFEHTLQLLDVKNSAAAHIGDDPTTDVKGAKSAGMISVWLGPQADQPVPGCDYHIKRLNELLGIF